MKINPIKLNGPWKDGYAIDRHTVSSTYLGDDEWGRPHFDTTRSDIGELVYQFKYNGNNSALSDIINLITPFLEVSWKIHKLVDIIIPIPPSNENRQYQPVVELSKAIGHKLQMPVDLGILRKTKNEQLKGLILEDKQKAIADSFRISGNYKSKVNVLLVDDLYDSGCTLEAATRLLQEQDKIVNVYVLTMTKTRSR